jgi:hypothetical protein
MTIINNFFKAKPFKCGITISQLLVISVMMFAGKVVV